MEFAHHDKIAPKLGVIPYQRTGQELRVGQSAAPVPTQPPYDDPAFFSTPILMQGLSPECGGYSAAFAIAYLLSLQTKLSGSFTYAFEKTVDGVPDAAGTTIAAIGQAAQSAGSCLDTLFQDDGTSPDDLNGTPSLYSAATPEAIQDAFARAGWLSLFLNDLSWNGLQAAISKYKTVLVEAEVGEEWWTNAEGKESWAAADVLPIRPPKTVIDSHFFVLGGEYDSEKINFANSWSTEWGENGFGYFQENYLPFIKNAIVLFKAPPSIQTIVNHPTLPQAEKNSLIQQILDDIEQAVALISKETSGN